MRAILPQSLHITLNTSVMKEGPALQKVPDPVKSRRYAPKDTLVYRGENKGLFVLLSRTQAGPGRTVKQEQEEISRNRIQAF